MYLCGHMFLVYVKVRVVQETVICAATFQRMKQIFMRKRCQMIDIISLSAAMETPVWMMVYAAEPLREINVTMTYADLKAIYDWIHEVTK